MTLAHLQQDFQAYLLDDANSIKDRIMDGAKADKDKMLAVYHTAYRARLVECLGDNYPVTWSFLGDDGFEQLCLDYIAANPSPFRSARWFGHELTEFAAANAPYNDHPVLAELIAFEWGLRTVFDAEDSDAAGLVDMAVIPPEAWPGLTFSLVPSADMMLFHWNAGPIWRALDKEETPPAPMQEDIPQAWLVWRKGLQSHYRSLDGLETQAIALIADGKSFADLCDFLTSQLEDATAAAEMAAGLLRHWIEDALIAHIHQS